MKKITILMRLLVCIFLISFSTKLNAQTSQTYTSSGTFVVPAGVTSVQVEAWGGGGRGGSRQSNIGGSGGGGGGAYAKKVITVTSGSSYTVTVGSGSTTNSPGGDSWFNTNTTILAKGGNSVDLNISTAATGGSSASCIGTVVYSGGNGKDGISGNYGGGGGSSAGTGSNGTNAPDASGAIAPSGGGNGGTGKSGGGGVGGDGFFIGGGGGGAFTTANGTQAGGNGGDGQIILTYTAPSMPEIDVQGNSISIASSDTTPSTSDLTNFGNVEIGSFISNTYTIKNTGNSSLTIGAISFSGTGASNYVVTSNPSATVAASGSTTFTVKFTPSVVGARTATISIVNNDSDENPYTFSLLGTGRAILTNGPGAVKTKLELWLRSDLLNGTTSVADNTAVNTWNTQARGSNATKPASVGAPVYKNNPTDNINFNSVVDFTNNYSTAPQVYTDNDPTRQYLKGTSGFFTQDMFVVLIPDVTITSAVASNDIFCGDRNSSVQETDATGIGYGAYTSRIVNEVLTFAIGTSSAVGNGFSVSNRSTTASYSAAGIINARNNAATNGQELYFNANDQVNLTTDAGQFANTSDSQYWIGRSEGWDGSLDGRVGEIITLNQRATTIERSNIQSYLAIKYGITLGINGTSVNYTNSDGTTIWDVAANSGFNYDIAGIGRDDISKLNQKQSKSINPTEVMTIGLTDILPTNTANTNTFGTDKNFLVWGSNGGNMNNSGSNLTIDLGPTTITTITEVVNRKWKVNEVNGDVPTTRVAIPTASFLSGLPLLGPTDAYVMVVATDAAFTTGLETVFMSTTGSNQTCLFDFDNTKYITFGVAHRATNPLHITLDGFDDYVRIADSNELGSTFSIMTWVRSNGTNTLNNERTILAKTTATNGYKLVLQNDRKIRMEWTVSGTTYSLITNVQIPNAKWHNVAVTYGANTINMYIDGVLDTTAKINTAPVATTSTFSIGAQYINKTTINNLWKGDIDELRMWSRVLSVTEIRFVMNQEILQNGTGTIGTIIPSTITKNDISTLLWNNLFAYYSMNSYIGTHLDDDSFNKNRGSLVIPDKISINVQTAPMPYVSSSNGLWSSTATWANGSTQDLPYSNSIVTPVVPIDWNIVRTLNDVDSGGNKTLLGLFVDANTLTASNDTSLDVSHYLKLNGKIDLVGKSQLIQRLNSDLDKTSAGSIERDQLGQKTIYNYNYWSSPVGTINNTTNNNNFTVAGVMKDGTTATPQNLLWTGSYNGSPTTPAVTLSTYWIYKFTNLSNTYANWQYVGQNGTLKAAEGFTLKGSGTALANQTYTFVGKPNNGPITAPIAASNLNLVGNPYPSSLDATAFINANLNSTTGVLYFWEHYSTNNSHNLAAYQGGYATKNLMGATPPAAPAGISGLGSSAKTPKQYIPVGQGFFVEGSATGGTITFNNNQREFVKEDNATSFTLFKNNSGTTGTTTIDVEDTHFNYNQDFQAPEDTFKRVRLGMTSVDDFHRQILIGFAGDNATSGIDPGYDAINIDEQPNEIYFMNSGKKLTIAGEGYFDVNTSYPLGVTTNNPGNVKFTLDGKENLDTNQDIFIYDNVTNTYNSISETQDYVVNLPQATIENRFFLTFKNTALLGVGSNNLESGINIAYSNTTAILAIANKTVDTTIETVGLFNILGQQVGNYDLKNQTQTNIVLPLKQLATGTYIVKMNTDKGATSRKIIIN